MTEMATKTAQHTQKQWTCSIGTRGGEIMPDNLYNSPLRISHKWSECDESGIEAAANMKRIVLTVNSHDALLEACKKAAWAIRGGPSPDPDDTMAPWAKDAIQRLDTAVAKAEGPSHE